MSETIISGNDIEAPAMSPDKPASKHLLRRWTCGIMAANIFGYIFDATVISELMVPNDGPSISGPTSKQLSCKDAKAIGIMRAGTGLAAEKYMRDVMAPTFNASNLCVAALHEGRTSRADANGRAIGAFALSQQVSNKPVEVFIFADSEGGMTIPGEVKAIRDIYGKKVHVVAARLNATPDTITNLKKPDGRWYVQNYDLPYSKGVILASNLHSAWSEGKDMLDWHNWWYAWDNMTQTSIPHTKSQLKSINEGFPDVKNADELRNADGSLPEFSYMYVTTDDTVNAPEAVKGIQTKLHVPVEVKVIATDEPYMHAKEWLTDKYHIYEPTMRQWAEEISATIDLQKAA